MLSRSLSDEVRLAKLKAHMKLHNLEALWYGQALKSLKHVHVSSLEHPVQNHFDKQFKGFIRGVRPLHFLTAPEHTEDLEATTSEITRDEP